MILLITTMAIGLYLLWRRGRGPDQPTVWQDFKSLFDFRGERNHEDFESLGSEAEQKTTLIRDRDGHSIEADPGLTDAERIEEIMDLTELWNLDSEAEPRKGKTDGS